MTFKTLLTATCTLQEEMYITNEIGESERRFGNPVSVECRLNPMRGSFNDLELGKVTENTRYVLYILPDTTVEAGAKATINGTDYKVDRVDEFHNGTGKLHHKRCDLEKIE